MYQQLQDNINLFIKNKNIMKEVFKGSYIYLQLSNAITYTSVHREASVEKILAAKNLLKSKANIFSNFRGYVEPTLICNLSLADDAEAYYNKIAEVYNKIKATKLKKSEYTVSAAMIIVDRDYEHADEIIKKTEEMYLALKETHKLQINQEIIPLATILALSGKDKDELIKEILNIYNDLKSTFKNSEARTSLSCILALPEKCPKEKINYITNIYNSLKAQKHKYPKEYELTVFGMLAFLDESEEELVKEIIETDDILIKEKGFGDWNLGYEERRKVAVALVVISKLESLDTLKDVTVQDSVSDLVSTTTNILLIMTAMTGAMVLLSACRANH